MTISSKAESPKMFDAISVRYDFLNRFLSLGMDDYWRRCMVRYLPKGEDLKVLDIGAGTAHVAVTLAQGCSRITSIIGIDLSEEMMNIGRERIQQAGFSSKIILETADAQKLPFSEESFHAVTAGFALRNMPDLMAALIESYRVLFPGGKLIILELSRPESFLLAVFHTFYLKCVIPIFISIFSRDVKAYEYLATTGMAFPSGDRFMKIIHQVGFNNVMRRKLCLGAMTIYVAEK
ncbi:MAG: bifunctional demethylmenaquinone methyltransferase/2-methoxy-6-polyprenyl-1,4-benzoquinol methylase UbiE [Candidatus Omnitrophica bacterium]|nr:bifunctional demethylmenaquinone methyltransferase/2-methoxy-6-polyprenyl-1,4-benzoquinol methylase UbiE [Candidatus Omnitrophota bacterium]